MPQTKTVGGPRLTSTTQTTKQPQSRSPQISPFVFIDLSPWNENAGLIKEIRIIEIPDRFYFKVSSAARYLGISRNSLRKYTDLGLIRAKRLPGGDRLYCKEQLDQFVELLEDAVHQRNPVGRNAIDLQLVQSDLSASEEGG
jgi:excisionase family DNA binding protein